MPELTLAAYFDTAGTESKGPVLVTVGCVATVTAWDSFDKRWLAVLGESGVSSFHMKRVAHWKDDLASWTRSDGSRDEERRAVFLDALINVAASELLRVFVRAVVVADYEQANARYKLRETVGGPYAVGQAACLISAVEWMRGEYGEKLGEENVGFSAFIEEGDTGQSRLRKFIQDATGWPVAFVPRLHPDTGEDITPLSVADLIAYEHRVLYDRSSEARRLLPREEWRGSLRALRDKLDVDTTIAERKWLTNLCVGGHVPRRSGRGRIPFPGRRR